MIQPPQRLSLHRENGEEWVRGEAKGVEAFSQAGEPLEAGGLSNVRLYQ